MKGRIGNLVIAGMFLLFTLTLILLGIYKWEYEASVIMFPMLAGGLLIASAVWLLIRAWLLPVEVLDKEGESVGESDDPRSSLLKRLFWMMSVYPLVFLLGFIPGLMILTMAYTSYHRLPWWQRMLAVTVVFIVVYIGFYKLLGVALPISPVWMRD